MESKKLKEKIIQFLNKNEIEIYYEDGTNEVVKKCRFGSYLLEFFVKYETKENIFFDFIKYSPIEVSEILIYINNKLQILTDDDYEKINETLNYKIINN